MKKVIVTTLILTLALFVFPLSSFAKKDNDNGNGAFVCTNEDDISGLVFDFDPSLEVELPGFPAIAVTSVEVLVDGGSEMAVLTPSGRYNYHAALLGGTIFAYDEDVDEEVPVLVLTFESGTLNENFNIYDVEDPVILKDCEDVLTYQVTDEDVSLFFKVKEAQFCDSVDENGDLICIEPAFDIMLKLNHFVKFKF